MKTFVRSWQCLVAAMVAAVVGWGLAGRWAAPGRFEPTNEGAGPSKPTRVSALGKGRLDGEFAAVAAAGDVAAQMAAAVAMAARIDPKDFELFLENIRRLPAHAAQGLASRTVLRRWVALDPGAALAWCATHDRDLVGGVLDEWVRNTPPDQVARLFDQIPAAHRAQAIPSLFNALAAHDPEIAIDLLTQPGAGQSIPRIGSSLDQLARRDPGWLLESADRLPDKLRQRLRTAAAQAMVEAGEAEAFSWVASQPDRNTLLMSLAENPKNVPAVLAVVAGLPHEEQGQLDLAFLGNLGREGSCAFVDAIAIHHGQFSEMMLRNMLTLSAYALAQADDPGALANRLLALGVDQVLHVGNFAVNWAHRSPEAARTWAASLADESKRREAIEAIDATTRPPDVFSPESLAKKLSEEISIGNLHQSHLLLAINEEERRQVLAAGFGQTLQNGEDQAHPSSSWQTLSSSYPAEAARWLAESLTPHNAPELLEPLTTTASHWAAENPAAAAEWAASLPPGESRAWAAANVVDQWRHIDATAARAWIESLPPDERPIAAKTLGNP